MYFSNLYLKKKMSHFKLNIFRSFLWLVAAFYFFDNIKLSEGKMKPRRKWFD